MDLDFCVEIALWTKNEKKYYVDDCSATNFDGANGKTGKTLLFENVAGWMTILLAIFWPFTIITVGNTGKLKVQDWKIE